MHLRSPAVSLALALVILSAVGASTHAATKKVVLIAGPKSHGPIGNGIHDYPWSVKLLKVMLDNSNVRELVRVEYHLDGFPADLKTLDDADTIMVISDGRDGELYQEAPHFASEQNLTAVQKQIDRGCGFLTFHFSTFAPDKYSKQILDWSGGYFDWETDGKRQWYSAIQTQETNVLPALPQHQVIRGVQPFRMKEEFYFNIRFAESPDPSQEVSAILSVPSLPGREPDGKIVAWARQRPNGGRGFGTTCGHFYANWQNDDFRKTVLNAIVWTAGLDVPADGVQANFYSHAEVTSALAGVEGTQRAELDDRPIRALLLAGNDAHKWHNWEKTTPAIKAALERDPRMKVNVTLEIEELAKRDLKQYDVIVQNYVNWHDPRQLSDASKTAFVSFLQNGGGLLLVHFSGSAFHFSLPMAADSDWPEYRKFARRVWNHHGQGEAMSGHDAFGRFTVQISELSHPITAGLKDFEVNDELYFKQDGTEPIEPLITAKSKITQRDEPLAFVYQYGKGRVFQTLLGHSEQTYDVFAGREMLRRAAAWVANRRVLRLLPNDDPDRQKESPQGDAKPADGKGASVRLSPGRFGSALDARAAGLLIDAKPIQRNAPLSIEGWCKLASKTGFNILIASEPKASATHWELYSYAGSGVLSAYLPGRGGEYRTNIDVCDDQWHHVAMALDANRIRLFVDGELALDKALSGEFRPSTAGAIAFGRLVEGTIGADGLIDDVRIRRGIHPFGRRPETPHQLDGETTGLWRFDELLDNDRVKDESAQQSHAFRTRQTVTINKKSPAPAGTKTKDRSHWGKSQVGFDTSEEEWVDNRWQQADVGNWLASLVALPEGPGRKTLSIRVGESRAATVCFDTQNCQLRAIWTGGFLKFNPARYGIISPPRPDGDVSFAMSEAPGWGESPVQYRGMHVHGDRIVFSYSVDGTEVRESPWCEMLAGVPVVTRTVEIGPSDKPLEIHVHRVKVDLSAGTSADVAFLTQRRADDQYWTVTAQANGSKTRIVPVSAGNNGVWTGAFRVPAHQGTLRLRLCYLSGSAAMEAKVFDELAQTPPLEPLKTLIQPGPRQWTESLVTTGRRAADDAPYVLDTLTLPFDNPYKALFFTSGHDFLSNGDIAVCTLHGDVWLVSGVDENLDRLEWRRFATGLHQPLGLVVKRGEKSAALGGQPSRVDSSADSIYVLGRDQITRLHDFNNDGEADYYECFSNLHHTSAGGHDYVTCLETDSQGNFVFLHATHGVCRISKDGSKLDVLATGLRNPNGLGVGPGDVITASPQEGEWTPASTIVAVHPGQHYGYGGPRISDTRPLGYDPPLCWIPRRVDNSSGGQVWVNSDRWGPLSGQLLHLSFGQCRLMLVPTEGLGLRAGSGQRAQGQGPDAQSPLALSPQPLALSQGGLVEFPFQFDSGAMRGRFSPHDGQLYVTGLRGWVTSAVTDGCLQRVRYTGQPVDVPIGVKTYQNGLAVAFTRPLVRDVAEDPGNYHAEQWNYKYSSAYGSAEYRVSDSRQEGRDEIRIQSATLLDERTVFLELHELVPVNVLAISFVLKPTAGAEFRRTLYYTVNRIGPERIDESRLHRRTTPGVLDDSREAELRPGLRASFEYVAREHSTVKVPSTDSSTSPASLKDVRIDRMAALLLKQNEPPTPFLEPAPFRVIWEGFVRVPLKQTVAFSFEGQGHADLSINDRHVSSASGNLQRTEPASVTLNGGYNKLSLEYTSPTRAEHSTPGASNSLDHDAMIRLMWESPEFAREPVPPTVLFCDSSDPDLIRGEQLRRGRFLFASMNCGSCHASPGEVHAEWEGPNLSGTSASRSVDWLVSRILDPHQDVPNARMPRLLASQAVQEAIDLSAFLISTASPSEIERVDRTFHPDPQQAETGAVLFEELGCIACHRLTPQSASDEFNRRSLSHASRKFRGTGLEQFLLAPSKWFRASRMPDFHLNADEASALAHHIRQSVAVTDDKSSRTLPNAGDPSKGRELFEQRGCIHCHGLAYAPARPRTEPIPLSDLRSARGCLAEMPHHQSGVPWYPLSPVDRAALATFAATNLSSLARDVTVEASRQLVDALRCAACHDRDGLRSPRGMIIVEESNRGIPPETLPNLTWAGEKLHANWTQGFLAGDLKTPLRPWMKARMPAFPAFAQRLAAGLSAEHGIASDTPNRFAIDKSLAELGNSLTQKTALDCRQCHGVGADQPQGDDKTKIALGINFAHTAERMRYDYYQRFTLDPPRFDIGSKMPKLTTDGKHTKVTTILNGDARLQFDSIWHFLQSVQR